MNIAIIAHDKKKELMIQFCTAYESVFKNHTLCGTATTAKLVCEATGLSVHPFLSGAQGGVQQIGARIAYNEIDMILFFSDPLSKFPHEPDVFSLLKLCDSHNIPIATNIATAEALVLALGRGEMDWREFAKSDSVII